VSVTLTHKTVHKEKTICQVSAKQEFKLPHYKATDKLTFIYLLYINTTEMTIAEELGLQDKFRLQNWAKMSRNSFYL
jgi:hypothetical protein